MKLFKLVQRTHLWHRHWQGHHILGWRHNAFLHFWDKTQIWPTAVKRLEPARFPKKYYLKTYLHNELYFVIEYRCKHLSML